MTISTTSIKNSYSGDNSTTVFNYTFKVSDEDEIQVIIRASTGTETVKTKTTHYTVSGVGNANGGSVTFTTGNVPTNTETVVLRRSTPQTQGLDLIENDPMPAENIETAYDKLTAISQELQEQIDRSIKLSRTNTMTSTEFGVDATNRANKILAFDSSGEIAVTQELGTFKGTDATVTTAAYAQRDIIKSTTTAQLNNVYICVADSVVGDSLTDTDHFALLVDAVSAASSATSAASSASTATTKASEAATSATNAATSETNAAPSASTASTKASEASASAASALSSKNAAATSETNAATSETNAAASASAAASAAGGGTVSITNADTTANKLNDKLLVSGNLTKTVNNAGSSETLTLDVVTGDITVEGLTFANYTNITANATTTLSASKHHFLFGPITVNSGATWTVSGSGTLNIITN